MADARRVGLTPELTRQLLTKLPSLGVWIAIGALFLTALVVSPAFFSLTNLQDVLRRSSILGIVTMGQVLVLMTGGLDLSVGAMIGVTAVVVAESASPGSGGLVLGIVAIILVGFGVGLTNGLLVAKRRVPPFVATFGMLIVLEGARLAFTAGTPSGNVPEGYRQLARGTLFGLPYQTLVLILLVIGLTIFTRSTVKGRQFVMAGTNERMAYLSGISVTRMKTAAYIASALLAVLAGLFFASFIGYVDRFVGRGADLDSISAALLGGTTFSGGEGSFLGSAAGAFLIVALFNLIVINGLPIEWQLVAKGLVLIAAVALQTLGRGAGT